VRKVALFIFLCSPLAAGSALADDPLAAIRAACAQDAQRLCAGVQQGGGRIVACLKEHRDALSDGCKQAAAQAANPSNGSAPSASSALPAPATNGSDAAATSPPASSSHASSAATTAPVKSSHASAARPSSSAATTAASGSYLRMKQVQVISHIVDPALGSKDTVSDAIALPALDLLIPSTWDFKGSVELNRNEGCISDMYSVSWLATSADGSIAFAGAPDYSWQYADDPAALRNLTDPNRRHLGMDMKPCPVAKPMKAEDYFRQKVLTFLPSDSTVVSVEPFPELNQIARKQLGLPPDDAGKAGDSRTEAIRARVEYQKDGKPMENWVALVVVTRIFRQGRGAFYDCHAIDVMSLRAPQGKLDANDKLFKVMISSLRLEPKFQAYANGNKAKWYQLEAQKLAKMDAIWAAFQNHVAETIMGVTANQQQGSLNSAFGADQLMRGVQTFRNPATGSTMELSNQYDHAWLNGSNEYILSDDPNFNPNGQLNGSWNQLQAVRPAP